MDQTAANGWTVVAEADGAAALVGAILQLDANDHYTRSELADEAGVPLKDLYLSDALAELVDAGLLESVTDAEEATYAIDADSPVYETAAAFDDAVQGQLQADSQQP
jgi:hypothetical protein